MLMEVCCRRDELRCVETGGKMTMGVVLKLHPSTLHGEITILVLATLRITKSQGQGRT